MMDSDAVVVHVQMTLEDGVEFQRSLRHAALHRPYRPALFLGWIFLGLSVVVVPSWLVEHTTIESPVTFVVSVAIGFLPLVLVLNHAARKSWNRGHDPRGLFLRPHDVSVSSHGVWFKSDVADLKFDWPAFLRVEETPTHFFLYTDKLMAYIVPKRGFKNAEETERFGAMLRANIKPAQPSA